jgi:hypothetical protein
VKLFVIDIKYIKMKRLEIGCGDRPSPGFMHQDIVDLIGGASLI